MDLLDDIRKQINDRLAELRPLTVEYERLQQVHAALSASGETDDAIKRGGRAPGTASAGARRSAPRGSARERTLAAARDNPDAKRGDIAQATGLSPNTVGSTLSKLRAEGLLARSPRSRAAATSKTATEPAATTDAATDTPIAEPARRSGLRGERRWTPGGAPARPHGPPTGGTV